MNILNHIKNYTEFFVFNFLEVILPKSKNNENSLLLINTGEMGDLIVSSILLENPDIFSEYSRIEFIIKEQYIELFSNYKGRVKFIEYNYKKYKSSIRYKYKFLSLVRLKGFRKCIHLTAARGILNEEMTHLSGAEEIITINSFTKYLGKSIGNYFNKKYSVILATDILNEYEKHFELISYLSGSNDYAIGFNNDKVFNTKLLESDNNFLSMENTIVVAPFSSTMNRDWKIKYFQEVVEVLSEKYQIILIGSKNQEEKLIGLRGTLIGIEVYAGKLKLSELPNFLSRAKLFIGLDSGLAHIALKIGTPFIAIIGGGEFGRFFPYRESEKAKYLFHKMDCFNCNWECDKSEMFCMTEIKPEDVLLQVSKMIN